MNEDRITELEIKIAYHEDLVIALNAVVADQQKQIDRLEEICKVLNEKIIALDDMRANEQGSEIPPHY